MLPLNGSNITLNYLYAFKIAPKCSASRLVVVGCDQRFPSSHFEAQAEASRTGKQVNASGLFSHVLDQKKEVGALPVCFLELRLYQGELFGCDQAQS
jgi:hypothetical protein